MKLRGFFYGVLAVSAAALLHCSGDDEGPQDTTPSAEVGAPCSSDDDCAPPAECRAMSCQSGRCQKRADVDGKPIAAQVSGDCQTIVCTADGTTRAVADDGDSPPVTACTTRACSAGKVTEVPLAAASPCTDGRCDGAGACVKALGNACSTSAECPSGHCVDGVCCNEACTSVCKACNVDGGAGVCVNLPYYAQDPRWRDEVSKTDSSCSFAVGGATCDGDGGCKKISGTQCTGDSDCMSNKCSAQQKCVGRKGEGCFINQDCLSGTCSGGTCT